MRPSFCFLLSALLLAGCEQRGATTKPAASAPVTSVEAAKPAPVAETSVPLPPADPVAAVPMLEAPIHLPASLAAGQKAPLLLMLHAIGTSADDIQRKTDWARFAEAHDIAWIAPNGPVDALGRRFWDAGPSCCNFTGPHLDHVAALRNLLERTLERYPIDRERVFVGGISNGGFMAHRLGCEAPDLIRGVVSVSGAGPLEAVNCRTPTNLRVLEIHGDADPIVSYAGGHFLKMPSLPLHASVEKTMTDWASRLGCSDAPVAKEPIDIETRFAGKETRVSQYQGCKLGKLELWTVTGGDHYLAFHDPAPAAIWQFLTE